jgi:hypothetical protein
LLVPGQHCQQLMTADDDFHSARCAREKRLANEQKMLQADLRSFAYLGHPGPEGFGAVLSAGEVPRDDLKPVHHSNRQQ